MRSPLVQNDHKQLAAWLELQQKCVYAYVYVMTQGTKDPFRVKATDTLIEPYASEWTAGFGLFTVAPIMCMRASVRNECTVWKVVCSK